MKLRDDGSTFEAPPSGNHIARLYRLIDLGTQEGQWQGKPTSSRKALLSFELLGDDRMSDGRPFTISRRFTASVNEKAALRLFLESWRGKRYSTAEIQEGVDLSAILGAYGLLNCVEAHRDGHLYINIAGISPLPKGMPKPPGVNAPVLFDLAAPDWDVFADLGERLQETILASPEGRAAYERSGTPAGSNRDDDEELERQHAAAAMEDDIPFNRLHWLEGG